MGLFTIDVTYLKEVNYFVTTIIKPWQKRDNFDVIYERTVMKKW